ncbi:MAG TPA: polysaccharide deacetylase family protein [Candidatus Omnitrophota bacterium]|nr:polysaccharide deacetylase family protein [Candidatus Omnitrophota bacterium]HRZ15293.1 polysaccharide deacetylase family protein [Candidatus Omnitrophota bacterium]
MHEELTVIKYHYVRPIGDSRYPGLKGLEVSLFEKQLQYLRKHHAVVSVGDVVGATGGKRRLPGKAALLTFDDGYSDHFNFVFPLLRKYGMAGAFYVPFGPIAENKVMGINKIHFIRGAGVPMGSLLREVFAAMRGLSAKYAFRPETYYREKYGSAGRFDDAQTMLVKRLLQFALPAAARREILDRLFAKYVGVAESAFSRELYLTFEQIACMRDDGMHIGSHGYEHAWLNTLSRDRQRKQIDRSVGWLVRLKVPRPWSFCYPHGGFNATTLSLVRERGFKLGFGVQPGIADLDRDDTMVLPRLDTNDLQSTIRRAAG